MQIVIKLVLTVMIAGIAVVGLFFLWTKDIDIKKTFSPKKLLKTLGDKPSAFLVTRDSNRIYQNSEPVADVAGVTVDEENRVVLIEEMSRVIGFDDSKECEFKKHILRMESAAEFIGVSSSHPEKSPIMRRARFRIVGKR